jgi:hypothetical protein
LQKTCVGGQGHVAGRTAATQAGTSIDCRNVTTSSTGVILFAGYCAIGGNAKDRSRCASSQEISNPKCLSSLLRILPPVWHGLVIARQIPSIGLAQNCLLGYAASLPVQESFKVRLLISHDGDDTKTNDIPPIVRILT